MNKFGYMRVASAIPSLEVGNIDYNVEHINAMIDKAFREDVDVILFPELSITGYTCGDLFHTNLKDRVEKALDKILKHIKDIYEDTLWNITAIVGAPRYDGDALYNSAFILHKDGMEWVDKTYLPNYKEFYEKRWFKSGENSTIFEIKNGMKFGVEICEDVWSPNPPSTKLALQGADVIFNLSASNDLIGKYDYLSDLLKMTSAKNICGYVYAGAGFGESTQDLVFDGKGFIFENGHLLSSTKRFQTEEQLIISDIDIEAIRHDRISNITFQDTKNDYDYYNVDVKEIEANTNYSGIKVYRHFNPHPFYSDNSLENDKRFTEIFNIQVFGLMKRLKFINAKAVIGVSGGSDSTLALLVCREAMLKLKRSMSDIIAVTMPGFATSERTLNNSLKLAKSIGATLRVIDIKDSCTAELKALNHPLDVQDVTYENVQARMRTSILMNIANAEKGIVIGTGDLSELALGWCTYNGDHMSMYAVNSSIPKTLVKKLIRWYADKINEEELKSTLLDVLDTPVSPELTGTGAEGKKSQVTEENIGPYELHDFFLYNFLRHGYTPEKIFWMAKHTSFDEKFTEETIQKWLTVFFKRFFSNQFKRSCLPDGPKIGSVSLSPRGDWRMPSDVSSNLFENS